MFLRGLSACLTATGYREGMQGHERSGMAVRLALVALVVGAVAGCTAREARLPGGPPPGVTPQELLLEHNAWVPSHRRLLAGAELPRLTAASALLAVFEGFPIEPQPQQEMRLDDVETHTVLSEYGPNGGRLVRRIWFSRYTLRPERVETYDPAGQTVLHAEMLGYERIGATDVCAAFEGHRTGGEEVRLSLRLDSVDLKGRPRFRVEDFVVSRTPHLQALAAP